MRPNISHKFLGNCISFYVNSLLMSFICVLFFLFMDKSSIQSKLFSLLYLPVNFIWF